MLFIKEDIQYFLDELSMVGNLIVTKAADMGETRWSCNMSPEMQALFLLSFFKGLIETMMPEKLKNERQEWRDKLMEKYQKT